MSKWLAKALEVRSRTRLESLEACADCANCAKTAAPEVTTGGFGTNGTIGTAPEISNEEIRQRFAWIRQRLQEEHRRSPARAKTEARVILRSDLLNDARLAPLQPDPHLCLVCGELETAARLLIPVLTARKDNVLWLHSHPCHGEHVLYRRRQIDDLIRTAVLSPRDAGHAPGDELYGPSG